MKKNSLIEGAMIATIGIIIVKVIGLLYVIPFNAIIGEKGGALYGYAYNVYSLFLSISSAGFPFAISKLISEYLSLGYDKAIKDIYKISIKLIFSISVIVFLILFIFSPQIGKIILGSSTGGITYKDISYVIRTISFSILIIPFLSVTRGFLQGHKYIKPASISQIIEQIVRVIIILIGSYLAFKVFQFDLKTSIALALSGAFFGGLIASIYLKIKIKKAKILTESGTKKSEVTTKEIINKILKYSIPFILISLIYNLYNTIDMVLISRTMTDILRYPSDVVESIVGIFTTWGIKLNNIVLALTTGLTTSLIPNIVSSYTKKDMSDVNSKFNKAIQYVLLLIVPITLFLALLSKPIWTLFYGYSIYGPEIYQIFVFSALFGGICAILMNILQGLSKYKLVIISVLIGLILNAVLDVPMMLLADYMGLQVSYGAILAAIIGYSVSMIISINVLKRKYGFNFNATKKRMFKYVCSWVIFVIIILLLKKVIPVNINARIIQIPILAIFALVSFSIYFIINYYSGNLDNLFKIKRGRKK